MTTERLHTTNSCRLCNTPLHTFELERRICTVCEGYAEQLGARDEDEVQQAVDDLLREPSFRRLTGQT